MHKVPTTRNFKYQDIKQKEPPQKYRFGTISNIYLLAVNATFSFIIFIYINKLLFQWLVKIDNHIRPGR